MRQLSGCDFCGDTASGTFEVLPASYDPEGEGKRMLLCDHCRGALASILDPLLDAKMADVEPDITPDQRLDAEPTSVGSTDADPSTDADSPTDGDSSTDAESATSFPDDDAVTPSADGVPTDESSTDESSSDSSETSATGSAMAATGAGSSSRVPKGYRKVLRFLENREFPIDRTEAVEVTAGAYGMDEAAVEAAIDHAVKHDRMKSFDGELREV